MGASLLSPTHLVVLAVIGLLLFGAKRLPEVGRSLGTGMREFKNSVSGITDMAAPSAVVADSDTEVVAPLPLAEIAQRGTRGTRRSRGLASSRYAHRRKTTRPPITKTFNQRSSTDVRCILKPRSRRC